MRKFLLLAASAVTLLAFGAPAAFAHVGEVDEKIMHVFVREGCPHCAAFKAFMSAWEGAPSVAYYEVMEKPSQLLFAEVQKRMPGLQQGVPTIILDGHIIQGYDKDETTGQRVRETYEACKDRDGGCITFDEFLAGRGAKSLLESSSTCSGDPSKPCEAHYNEEQFIFDFWFVGRVDLRDLSLPVLSIVLGGLDGFNPCAMWVLITLLTLLINTRSLTKVWVIGGTFLLVSGAMYYIFIAAWLNVFLLIGYNQWVQKIIGIVAIAGGSFYLYEAFGKDPNTCKITDYQKRARTIDRMKSVVQAATWPAMILGVSILAISVNLIELVCTAGLPAIFTQILAFNPLTHVERYMYLGLYILTYMLDDLIIFGIAVATLHATGFTTKYRRFTMIFGGVLMAVLGVLLIFWPEALTFA
jgi:glutaredoxin/cytochrome c biogenesis protein CcdA